MEMVEENTAKINVKLVTTGIQAGGEGVFDYMLAMGEDSRDLEGKFV